MDIVAFNPMEHLKIIRSWLKLHHMSDNLAEDLPSRGFIVMERDKGVAAGFLRTVESKYVILDSLITNPQQSSALRNDAIDMLVDRLIITARKMGVTKILANTNDDNTLKRSKKFGFIAHPLQTVITLDL